MNRKWGKALIKNHQIKNPNPKHNQTQNMTKQTKKTQTAHIGILLSMKKHLSNTVPSSSLQKSLLLILEGTLKTESKVCKMLVELMKPQRCCTDIDK